jgi:uncharacterized protein
MRIVSAAPSPRGAPAVHRPGLRCIALPGLWLLLALCLGGCAWLDTQQSRLALRPTPGRPASLPADDQLFRPGDERWLLPVPPMRIASAAAPAPGTPPDQLALWWLPHPDPRAPALLYLHGTFRNLYLNLPKIQALRDAGFHVLAVDYRGWGDSTAIVPDEETIAADARTAWGELQRRQPQPGRRVIYGHSMGGAVAVRLASTLKWQHDYGALVVESSFSRMPDVAAQAGFVGRVAAGVTTLQFDALARMPQVDAPVLLLHGSADRTVPISLGRRLRDVALQAQPAPGCVRWVEFAGGSHSHLHDQFKDLYTDTFRSLAQRLPLEGP